jgi:predicted O-methyltransferase YrrM
MDPTLRAFAEAARGFMPPDEGLALHDAARAVPVDGPFVEIGSYCGKSALYLGAAARDRDTVLFAVDHHRGSEENQAGWPWHEADLVDPAVGRLDTLPVFRRTIHDAGLEPHVIAVVGDSPTVAAHWGTPLALVFIDGGHGTEPAHRDYESWAPKVRDGGYLVIHDVFPDPADGGRPPYEIYCRALGSGAFVEVGAVGSLRVLQRTVAGRRGSALAGAVGVEVLDGEDRGELVVPGEQRRRR